VSVLISVRSVVVGTFANIFRNRVFRAGEVMFLTISGSFPGGQLESKGWEVRRRDNCDGSSKAYSFSTLMGDAVEEGSVVVGSATIGVSGVCFVGFGVH